MKRGAAYSIRLDITGLEPQLFKACMENSTTVIQSRSKDRQVWSGTTALGGTNHELASIPEDKLAAYNKIVSICVDFERAYGRSLVRVFQKSTNKLLNALFRGADSQGPIRPTFYVNGVKVYTGIPNTFSELDEAIDKSFGRKNEPK